MAKVARASCKSASESRSQDTQRPEDTIDRADADRNCLSSIDLVVAGSKPEPELPEPLYTLKTIKTSRIYIAPDCISISHGPRAN